MSKIPNKMRSRNCKKVLFGVPSPWSSSQNCFPLLHRFSCQICMHMPPYAIIVTIINCYHYCQNPTMVGFWLVGICWSAIIFIINTIINTIIILMILTGGASVDSRSGHKPSKVLWGSHSLSHKVHFDAGKKISNENLSAKKEIWWRCLVFRMQRRSPTKWPIWGTIQTTSGQIWVWVSCG